MFNDNRSHIFVGLIMAIFVAWVTIDFFDNEPPYEYDASKSFIVPPIVEEGQQITIKWKVKLNRVCEGVNHRTLFDPKTHVILTVYDVIITSDLEDVSPDGYLNRTILLPRGGVLPLGQIGYRAKVSYSCNLLQHIWPLIVSTPDLFFTLKEAK